MTKPNVLVLCTGNSARSQIAEALIRKHGGEHFNVYSAGTEPKGLNPFTIQTMDEIGIDVRQHRSKHLNEFLGKLQVHYLVIVCGDADGKCPAVWPGVLERLFWPFDDPAAATGSDIEKQASFRRVRDQIEHKVIDWLKLKGHSK